MLMDDVLILLGFLLIMLGFAFITIALLRQPGAEMEAGGVLLIGPFPIVFGTDRKIAITSVLVTLLVLVVILWMLLR